MKNDRKNNLKRPKIVENDLKRPKERLKTTKMVVLAKFLFAFCGDVPLLAVGCFDDKSVFSHFSKKITYLS